MGSVGNTVGDTRASGLLDKIQDYDKRLHTDIINAANSVHKEFPEVNEFTTITTKYGGSEVASMNGIGVLNLNPSYFRDYESLEALAKARAESGWLAGKGTVEDALLSHELGHNLDLQFSNMLSNYSPIKYGQMNVKNDDQAEAFSYALGRTVKAGDKIDVPEWDFSAKFITIDGKKYSIHDMTEKSDLGVSSFIVPMAIANIQKNYKKFGFSHKPTESELVSGLSGYANYNSPSHPDYHKEIFAESYSSHKSYGNKANALAKEVMRITKQAYSSATKQKLNPSQKFFSDYFEAGNRIILRRNP